MSNRRRMMMAYNASVVKDAKVGDLPIGSKIKLSNGMVFILSVFDDNFGGAIFLSEHILEVVPWATGNTLVEYLDADISTITLKKYYDTLSAEEKGVLTRNGFSCLLPPMGEHVQKAPIEYRTKSQPKDGAIEYPPEDYWTTDTRKERKPSSGGGDPSGGSSNGWLQYVEYVDSAGDIQETFLFSTGKGYDPVTKGAVAAFLLDNTEKLKFEAGYWKFAGDSLEISEL